MAENSKIEWTHHTFNPWEGCTKVSAGCTHCYAEARAKRFGVVKWGPDGTRRIKAESGWREPLKWDRQAREAGERRRVFCASLADVFEDRAELVAPRGRLLTLIAATPHLDWLLLTKRPENVLSLWDWNDGLTEYFPPNVWLGVSVEDQAAADARIPELLKIPAAVRFLSVEPLLGPVMLPPGINGPPDLAHPFIEWCIIGGESGPRARPCDLSWIRSLRDQCEAGTVPVFVKQLGARPGYWNMCGIAPGSITLDTYDMPGGEPDDEFEPIVLRDPKGGDIDEFPDDLKIREFPEPRKVATS